MNVGDVLPTAQLLQLVDAANAHKLGALGVRPQWDRRAPITAH